MQIVTKTGRGFYKVSGRPDITKHGRYWMVRGAISIRCGRYYEAFNRHFPTKIGAKAYADRIERIEQEAFDANVSRHEARLADACAYLIERASRRAEEMTMAEIEIIVKSVLHSQRRKSESDLLMAAKTLIYALDTGLLNYRPDVPESAFVRSLREAIAKAEA